MVVRLFLCILIFWGNLVETSSAQSDSLEDRFVLGISQFDFVETDTITEISKNYLVVPSLYIRLPIYRDGLRPGDLLVTIDEQPFSTSKDLSAIISSKSNSAVDLEFLRNGIRKRISSHLILLSEYQTLVDELMSTKLSDDSTGIYFDAEEFSQYVDRGNAYTFHHTISSKTNFQWDFEQYVNMDSAILFSTNSQTNVVIGLFGSHTCCNYMSLKNGVVSQLMNDSAISNVLMEKYTSLLVLKPEAYLLYEKYAVSDNLPAFLVIDRNRKLVSSLSITPQVTKAELLNFLQSNLESKR